MPHSDGGLRGRARAHRIPEWQHAIDQQHARKQQRDQRNRSTCEAVRRRVHHRAEIGGEGEEWSRHGLGQTVSGQKRLVAHPSGAHDLRLQQRQHYMAAAKDQGTGTVEGIEHRKCVRSGRCHCHWSEQKKGGEQNKRNPAAESCDRKIQVSRGGRRLSAAKPEAGESAKGDRGNLRQ